MKKTIIAMCIASSLIANETTDEVTKLSSGLKTLLSQEMIEVERSMKSIFSNMIAGNYEDIEKEATGIKNSFILKKKLTQEQKHELHTTVSTEFISQDKAFHATAGKLATAAEFEDKEDINKYFNQMTNSCVKCHSIFATHRFTNFE